MRTDSIAVTPISKPIPAVGSFRDEVFNTEIVRLSDALKTADDASGDGRKLEWINNEYSTQHIFSRSGKYFILQHGSYFALYDGVTNKFLKNLPFSISASTEPRWYNETLLFLSGNALMQYDVSTTSISEFAKFAEYAIIRGRGESDTCFDGNHMIFVGDDRFIFTFTLNTRTKNAVLDATGKSFDSLYLACPSGGFIVFWNQRGTARFNGLELFDLNGNFVRQLTTVGGHMDIAYEKGESVLIWTNSNELAPICPNGIVKVTMSGVQTCLFSLDWSLAVHIAGTKDYAIVTTYSPVSSAWPVYRDEILRIRLSGGLVERLVHHRSKPFNTYNWQPKACVSFDGTKIVFASNFGTALPTNYVDSYLINLSTTTPAPIVLSIEQRVAKLEKTLEAVKKALL